MNNLYLKTPIDNLTTPHLRKIVGEVILWCQEFLGTTDTSFTYHVLTLKEGPLRACGMYDHEKNKLMVFRNHNNTIKDIVKVVIHEYTHYLQDLTDYYQTLLKVGYYKHPQEIEAHYMEKFYSICWKDIKDDLI